MMACTLPIPFRKVKEIFTTLSARQKKMKKSQNSSSRFNRHRRYIVHFLLLFLVAVPCQSAFAQNSMSDKRQDRKEKKVDGKPTYKNDVYCESKIVSVQDSFDRILVGPRESLNEITFPGAMFYMNDFTRGSYNIARCDRAPITLYSDFYDTNLEDSDIKEEVSDVTSSGIAASVAALVQRKGETNSADSELKVRQFKSADQLSFALGASASYGGFSGSGTFGFDSSKDSEKIVAQFSQRYFAVRVDSSRFRKSQDWFASKDEAERMFKDEEKNGPLLYVSSVVYGRCLYFGMESSGSEMNIEAAAEGAFDGAGSAAFEASAKLKNVVNTSKINYVTIGGSAKQGAINNYDEFIDLLKEEPDNLNSGGPIAYVVRFVKNDKIAFVNMSTQYTERKCKKIGGDLEIKLAMLHNSGDHADNEMTRILSQVVVYAPNKTLRPEIKTAHKEQFDAFENFKVAFHKKDSPANYTAIGKAEFQFINKGVWEISNGAQIDLQNPQSADRNKFNQTTKTIKLFDDPHTPRDERFDIKVYVYNHYEEKDGGVHKETIGPMKFSELTQIPGKEKTDKAVVGAHKDMGSGDGYMSTHVHFLIK